VEDSPAAGIAFLDPVVDHSMDPVAEAAMDLGCCNCCNPDQVHSSPGSLCYGRFPVGIEVVEDIAVVVGLLSRHRWGEGWWAYRICLCRTF
jgi:hypothetical protein